MDILSLDLRGLEPGPAVLAEVELLLVVPVLVKRGGPDIEGEEAVAAVGPADPGELAH